MSDSGDFSGNDSSGDDLSGNGLSSGHPKPARQAADFAKSGLQDSSNPGSSKSTLSSSPIVQTLRKRHIGIPLLGLVLLAVIGFVVLSHDPVRLPHASTEPDPMASDRPKIADFTVQSTEGDTFKLSAHAGKVVLVSFWSSECTTCVLELPAFSELLKRYKSDGLEILSINLDPPATATKTTEEVWAQGKFDFKPYVDPTRAVAKTFQIETVPSGFVIDRKGRIAFNSYGANDWLAPETARLLEDLLLEE